ncbi:hypothetical protein GC197_07535 [bacterium]|nr:hypothetical protein [bacterium]
MNRSIPLLVLMLASGCVPSAEVLPETKPVAPRTASVTDSPQSVPSAFAFDQQAGIISLDTQIPPAQKTTFPLGLGSIGLETLSAQDGHLTFRYTPEVEGGYTIYECTVPISSTPLTIDVHLDFPSETSFDLSKCEVIHGGNLLLDPPEVTEKWFAPNRRGGPVASQ